jgi:hypothetical protein
VVRTSLSAGKTIEEEVGCCYNRFRHYHSCKGCSPGQGLVVGHSERMGGEGVYGFGTVSGVALFVSMTGSGRLGGQLTFSSSNHIVGIEAGHLETSVIGLYQRRE